MGVDSTSASVQNDPTVMIQSRSFNHTWVSYSACTIWTAGLSGQSSLASRSLRLNTAATGYISGTVLNAPNVRIVRSSFDDTQLIADTVAENHIVIPHITGLLRRPPSGPGPDFLIRLAGTGIIADWQTGSYGVLNPKVWSDVDDIEAITSLPVGSLHQPANKILQAAAAAHGDMLNAAIIYLPGIYGPGRGPGNKRSLLVPEMCENMIELRHAFSAQSDANQRSWVHVDDLMKLYLKLVEANVAGRGCGVREGGKRSAWFPSDQEPKRLSVEAAREMRGGLSWEPVGLYTWACNTCARADRAREVLGYAPDAPSLWDALECDLLAAVEHVKRNGSTYYPGLRL
ncbi:hypothetical protein K432DRAFT_410933 [Lepidopterella palustris CBS 459.81]|uniref:NAD-dependent epimerase/dehydratase domain-containing protein n=1 Tax=Lepidopterella palustris CBS 459.81 TaxID=1314670 RepID=A0A8E2DWS7_9PEZI|nr:hypothetical protein K432DRAFT_410933 [Lepidopterella palustris CBS 459.81]